MDNIGNNGLLKTFTKYVGLNIIGMVTSTIVILVDYIFVAHSMGAEGLAALSLVIPVYTIVFALGMMLGVGGGAKYAEHTAKGEQAEANKFFTLTLKLWAVISVVLVLAGVFFTTQITGLIGTGAEEELLLLSADYVRVTLLGSPILLLYFVFASFERNDGSPKVAMVAGLIASGMNIVMDYVFIIVMDLGTGGVIGATVVAMTCSLLFLLIYRLRRKPNYAIAKTKFAIKKVMSFCAVGAPSLFNTLLYSFLVITFNLTLIRLTGEIGVAAFGIITTMAYTVQNFFTGVAQGMQPLASYYYGKRNSSDLKKVGLYAIATNSFLAVAVIAFIFFFADNVVAIFNTEQIAELAELAGQGLRIYFMAFVFFGITLTTIAYLSVTSSPTFGLVMSLLQGGGVSIPLVLLLSRLFGVTGVWATYPIAEFMLSIVSVIFLVRANRIHRKRFSNDGGEPIEVGGEI